MLRNSHDLGSKHPFDHSLRSGTNGCFALGRELLELKRSGQLQEFGCNNIGQFAEVKHGIPDRDARVMAGVAEALETLPALRAAAEAGTLSFYELRLLTAYATPESDEACVRLAREYTVGVLSRVLRDLAGALDSKKSREKIVRWKPRGRVCCANSHALG